MYSDLLQPARMLLPHADGDTDVPWDYAYALHSANKLSEAEQAYRDLLAIQPDSWAALHNLSMILEQTGDRKEALALAEKATSLAKDDENIAGWYAKLVDRSREEEAGRQRREDFLRTAVQRWPKLGYYRQQLLCTLDLISGYDSLGHLAELSGIDEKYLQGHLRIIEEQGMMTRGNDSSWQINPHIREIIKRENSHAVTTKLIRGDGTIAFKPIFNSKQEYTVYSILIGLFPNHLVFPNMALMAIFQYERMRELLDKDDFRYYLMAQADFCITSTATYLPIVAFEVDSQYHDQEKQQQRDERKNRIFARGGVHLLRLRGYGKPTEAILRNHIIEDVRNLGNAIRELPERTAIQQCLARELDFDTFGQSPSDEE